MLDMGIIKVEVNLSELKSAIESFRETRKQFFEVIATEIRSAASSAITQMMNAEMTVFLGKSDQKQNKRNGYETKEYALKGIGSFRIRVPIDRNRNFESTVIPKHERIDPRLKEDLAVLHLAGISTRDIAMISNRILGVEVSKQTVLNSLGVIEERAKEWLSRPITEKYWGLYVDGTNFKIQRRGSTESEPSLVVLGINDLNKKSIIAIEPGTKDNAKTWESVFNQLIERGLDIEHVKIGIMDGLPGLENVFKSKFTKAVTARCWVHALRNACSKTPARLIEPFKLLTQRVMYAVSEEDARNAFSALQLAMGADADRAVRCLEKDLDSLLVHYRFEPSLWRALKTTNPIERVNKEFKKRFKSMGSIGERSLTCLVAFTALRLEMNWQKFPINLASMEKLIEPRTRPNNIEKTIEVLMH